ncbi:SseB family protein [soil metagenome]
MVVRGGSGEADSAGTPWQGRHFEDNLHSGDDGAAPEQLTEALRRFRSGELGQADVVDALRDCRLLIPLVARLGELGQGGHGHAADKSAELSVVTVSGPDGRTVMPAFSSVEAMRGWNAKARPVPASAVRVALAAASEDTDLVVLDPTAPTEFVVRRPALWALAQSRPWVPSHLDEEVLAAFTASAALERDIASVALDSGDADARLAGPELIVRLGVVPGLDRSALDALLGRMQERWSISELIGARVDSMAVKLESAD